MRFFIVAFFLIASSSALFCCNYAKTFGSMNTVKSVAWRAVLRVTPYRRAFEQQTAQECEADEQCVVDMYHYVNDKGKQAGLIWSMCYLRYPTVPEGQTDCGFIKRNNSLRSGYVEQQYRCVCNTDYCQMGKDFKRIYKDTFGDMGGDLK